MTTLHIGYPPFIDDDKIKTLRNQGTLHLAQKYFYRAKKKLIKNLIQVVYAKMGVWSF